MFKTAKFINLILPEGGNRNTENLDHVYDILQGYDGREDFEIVVPETHTVRGRTMIVNVF